MQKKKKIQDRYDSPSYIETYDRRYFNLQLDKFKQLVIDQPVIMGNLLDFGAGTGLLWDFFQDLDLHTQGESSTTHLKGRVRFIGIDLSRGMLQTFKNKVLKTKKTPPIDPRDAHLICCDGEHLPLRADLFSNVIALTTLQNLPNLHLGIQEMHRVGIQGGFQRISFLRKSMPKEELIKVISSKFSDVKLIEPKVGHNTSYSEDWIILAKKG